MQIEPKEWITRKESTFNNLSNPVIRLKLTMSRFVSALLWQHWAPVHSTLGPLPTIRGCQVSAGGRHWPYWSALGQGARMDVFVQIMHYILLEFVCLLSGQPKCITQIFIFKFLISDFIALFIFHPWCANLLFLFVYFQGNRHCVSPPHELGQFIQILVFVLPCKSFLKHLRFYLDKWNMIMVAVNITCRVPLLVQTRQ